MTVNIQRERCSSMAQIALYGFDIITGTNGGNGVRMSQIMEPGIGAANGSSKLLRKRLQLPSLHEVPGMICLRFIFAFTIL